MFRMCLGVGLCDSYHKDCLPLGLEHKWSLPKVSLDTKASKFEMLILNGFLASKTKVFLNTIANKI